MPNKKLTDRQLDEVVGGRGQHIVDDRLYSCPMVPDDQTFITYFNAPEPNGCLCFDAQGSQRHRPVRRSCIRCEHLISSGL